jgi:hypothetical protein
MSVHIKQTMKTSDLSKTPIVKKFGVRGARWYGRILFTWLYAMLIFSTARLWIYYPDFTFTGTWRKVIFGSLIAALLVVAASVLTRMRIKFFTGIEQLEASQKSIPN